MKAKSHRCAVSRAHPCVCLTMNCFDSYFIACMFIVRLNISLHVKEAWRYRTDATTVRKMLHLLSNRGKDEMCNCQLTVWCISTGCMVDIWQKCFQICMKGSSVCFMGMFTPLYTILHHLCGCLYGNTHVYKQNWNRNKEIVIHIERPAVHA